jgi:hypothetical protein
MKTLHQVQVGLSLHRFTAEFLGKEEVGMLKCRGASKEIAFSSFRVEVL